mmetsp:Transcript_4195/g.10890  ORF Transcript_4195/g.10890 Transcript_4195/m.10890 type:complete len:100 (-) Transcript_4195:67-366(-)
MHPSIHQVHSKSNVCVCAAVVPGSYSVPSTFRSSDFTPSVRVPRGRTRAQAGEGEGGREKERERQGGRGKGRGLAATQTDRQTDRQKGLRHYGKTFDEN